MNLLNNSGRSAVMIVLVILVVLFIFGGLPQVGYHQYGYAPSGLGTVLLVVLLVLLLK